MPRRFFSAADFSAESLELTGREAHHLERVLRMQPGESVWLFDGQGHEVLAQIVAVKREAVSLQVTQRRDLTHSAIRPVTIATGVPKGDRFRWLIEKATELGVQRIVPLVTQRSIVDPGQGKLDKLRQTIVESCKQCGRSQLMELTEPISWRDCLTSELPGCEAWMFLIGPEGGFTDTEVEEAITAGARRMQLGPRILRIETAVVAVATLMCLQ